MGSGALIYISSVQGKIRTSASVAEAVEYLQLNSKPWGSRVQIPARSWLLNLILIHIFRSSPEPSGTF
jgi:hypothetical protein